MLEPRKFTFSTKFVNKLRTHRFMRFLPSGFVKLHKYRTPWKIEDLIADLVQQDGILTRMRFNVQYVKLNAWIVLLLGHYQIFMNTLAFNAAVHITAWYVLVISLNLFGVN